MNETKISKRLQKINEQIEKNNAEFKKATPAQKRVLIAQDVIAQIKAKRFIAESGIWAIPSYKDNVVLDGDESVQKLFATKELESCNVCALGGLFMSCANLNNTTTSDDLNCEADSLGEIISEGRDISNGLHKFFSKKQLMLIEIYFERNQGYFTNCNVEFDSRFLKSIDFDHVRSFGEKYGGDDNKRLKAIMENIVANNGTFVPNKL